MGPLPVETADAEPRLSSNGWQLSCMYLERLLVSGRQVWNFPKI